MRAASRPPIILVMNRGLRRSSGVEQTLAVPAAEIPTDADAAFESLYRDSRDDVYGYVAGLLRDRAAAEDITALAFERAYRRRRGYDPKRGTRRAWLFGIARNAALDELRRRRRGAELVGDPADPTARPRSRCDAPPCARPWRSSRRASASWWL